MSLQIEETELEDEWITEFEKTDKLYENFYKEDIFYIHIHFVYINHSNNIEKIKIDRFFMESPNVISREELVGIIKRNYILNNVKYILLSMMKYNINIDTNNIPFFLKSIDFMNFNEDFFKLVKNIDSIRFEPTIQMFQDLNDLIFIFYEKQTKCTDDCLNPITQIIHSEKISQLRSNNRTKRVFIKSHKFHKKTIRK